MTRSDVAAATQGDRDAFRRLVDDHRAAVCAITCAITADPGAGEDAAQEAFLAAWRALPRLRDPDRFRPWLHQIARNQARMALRSVAARPTTNDPDAIERTATAEPCAECSLSAAQDADTVSRALAALPERDREVLVLYYREDRTTSELARELELSEATARKRLERARAALRSEVELALAGELRRTRPAASFTASVLAAVALWPRSAAAAPSQAPWAAPRGFLTAASAAVGALMAVALPLLASPVHGVDPRPMEVVAWTAPASVAFVSPELPVPEAGVRPRPADSRDRLPAPRLVPPDRSVAPAERDRPLDAAVTGDANGSDPATDPTVTETAVTTEDAVTTRTTTVRSCSDWSVEIRVDGDEHRLTMRNQSLGLTATVTGRIQVDPLLVSDRARIEQKVDGVARRIDLGVGPDGTLTQQYRVDGAKVPLDDAGRAWVDQVTRTVVQKSGVDTERVDQVVSGAGALLGGPLTH